MKEKNKFRAWLKRPHGFFLLLLYFLTLAAVAGSVALAVLQSKSETARMLSYPVYGCAAILSGYSIYTVVAYAPRIKKAVTEKLKSRAFTANILENYGFKTAVFALFSFGIAVAFMLINLVSAVRYRLLWYGALAAYYFVLMLFRGGVMLADRRCKKKFTETEYEKCKWKIYLASGAVLIVLEIAMMAAITQMVLSERPVKSGEIMAISNAAYTFYKVTMAIYNLFKAKKFSNPVTQALRNVNFADACMSVVSLTVLMLSAFGEKSDMLYLKASVGFAVCAAVIAMASVTIIGANKRLNALRGENEYERQP